MNKLASKSYSSMANKLNIHISEPLYSIVCDIPYSREAQIIYNIIYGIIDEIFLICGDSDD
jgi:hypothetical protein